MHSNVQRDAKLRKGCKRKRTQCVEDHRVSGETDRLLPEVGVVDVYIFFLIFTDK